MTMADLSPCPFCGGPAKAIVTSGWPDSTYIDRQADFGEDGVDIESHVFCHECGASGALYESDCFDVDDYDKALAAAIEKWEARTNPAEVVEAVKADARRYRRLLHEGLRFRIAGVTHESKAATDAAIDALPEPPPGSASRM